MWTRATHSSWMSQVDAAKQKQKTKQQTHTHTHFTLANMHDYVEARYIEVSVAKKFQKQIDFICKCPCELPNSTDDRHQDVRRLRNQPRLHFGLRRIAFHCVQAPNTLTFAVRPWNSARAHSDACFYALDLSASCGPFPFCAAVLQCEFYRLVRCRVCAT